MTELSLFPPSIADTLSTAVLLLDEELNLRYLNDAAETLLNISRQRQLGQNIRVLVPHDLDLHEDLQTSLTWQNSYTDRSRFLYLSTEAPITVDITVTHASFMGIDGILIEMEQVDRHLRISRDHALIDQRRATRELIRGMAHEIKNPLGGIRGSSQLLERELPNEELKEYTGIIIKEVDRLQSLINRMLGPNQLPQMETLNVHEVLIHVVELVSIEAPKRIRILQDYDPSIPHLEADRGQLIQVFLNLIRNAMQALGEKGNIRIRTRVHRHLTLGQQQHHRLVVGIEIHDNGPGIPEKLQPQLFYPMVSGREGGTGLGLSIAQHLIQQHDGLIEFDSKPGHTVFTVFLPLE